MSSPFQVLPAKAILTLMKKLQPPATHGRIVHHGMKYTKGGVYGFRNTGYCSLCEGGVVNLGSKEKQSQVAVPWAREGRNTVPSPRDVHLECRGNGASATWMGRP